MKWQILIARLYMGSADLDSVRIVTPEGMTSGIPTTLPELLADGWEPCGGMAIKGGVAIMLRKHWSAPLGDSSLADAWKA